MFDVVVIGGGPGGSTCAARLAQLGRRVLLLEQAKFPRFHLGESLLPMSMHTLDGLGLIDSMRERFIVKRGAQFHRDEDDGGVRFAFRDAFDARFDHAFQVPRDQFDDLVLRRAAALGAEVREEWSVTRVLFEGGRARGVVARDPSGAEHTVDARFVVDASGREALLARRTAEAGGERGTARIPALENTALYTHFRGIVRDEGEREGDILIPLTSCGWFWVIPFADGRTSVGAVVKRAWIKEQPAGSSPQALFALATAESPVMRRLLTGATQLMPAGAMADFSYRVRETTGDGWACVGDAGGFIDPLFSTGAHVAMYGGSTLAVTLDAALGEGDLSRARFSAWGAAMRSGTELFIGAVQSFYAGELTKYLFAGRPPMFMRRAITSMLTGDVFGEDNRWRTEMRSRFAPVAASPGGAAPGIS